MPIRFTPDPEQPVIRFTPDVEQPVIRFTPDEPEPISRITQIERAVGPGGVGWTPPKRRTISETITDLGTTVKGIKPWLKSGGIQAIESTARAVQHGWEAVLKTVYPEVTDQDIRKIFEGSETYPEGTPQNRFAKTMLDIARFPDMIADVAQAKREELEGRQPKFTFKESPITYVAERVAKTLPQTAIALMASVFGGPGVGLAVMGFSEFGNAAEQQAKIGASINQATAIGTLSGAAEIGGEMLVFPRIFKGIKAGGFSARAIADLILENAGQEAATGFFQQAFQTYGEEIVKGTDTRKAIGKATLAGLAAMPESAWVGGLSAGVTTTSITAAGKSLDVLKHITAVKETLENPKIEDIVIIDTKIEEVQKDTTIPEEQKKAIIGILGNITGDWETKIVGKIPGEITDLKSLEGWGNKVAKELGVDKVLEELAKKHGIQPNIVWQKTDKISVTKNAHAGGPGIGGRDRSTFHIKIYDWAHAIIPPITRLKKTIIHELGHFVQRPFRKTKLNAWEQRVPYGKRAIHHPEFKFWVDASIKNMFQEKRVFVPQKEAGPQEITIAEPTVTTPQGEIVAEKPYKPAGEIVDGRVVQKGPIPNMESIEASIDNYEIVKGIQEVPTSEFSLTGKTYNAQDNRYISELANTIGKSGEITPLIVVQDKEGLYILEGANRAEALYRLGAKSFPALVVKDLDSLGVTPQAKPPAPAMAKKKPSGKKLKRDAHKIQREYKINDEDFYALEKEITGKTSMKDMTVGEMSAFVKVLQETYGPITGLSEDDLERLIFFQGKWVPAKEVFGPVVSLVDGLPNVGETPTHIIPGGIGAAPKKLAVGIWRVFMGLHRARPSRLFNQLGGFKDTILTDIGHDFIEGGAERKSNHQMSFYTDGVWKFFADKGFDSAALAKISRTQWRGPMPYEIIKELLGKGLDRTDVKFGKTTYSITRDSLTHHYLQVRQPEGMAHAIKDGLIFAGIHTGPLTEAEVTTQIVNQAETDPFCVAAAEWIDTVAPYYWRDPTNNISVPLIGKKIATKKNWYTLSVEETPRYGKLGFKLKVEKKVINLLENPSYFKERKGPTGALQDGSFFETIEAIEEAISDYIAYAPSLRLVLTLLGHEGLVRTWRQKGYGDFHKALNEIVPNEMGSPGPRSAIELAVAALTRGGARGLFHWNLKTAGIQFSSIFLLRKHFDAEYVRAGSIGAATHKMGNEFERIVPWAWCRQYMDRGPRMIGGIAEHGGLTLQMQGKFAANQVGAWLLKFADREPFHVAFWATIAEYDDYVAGKIRPGTRAETYWAGKPIVEKNSSQWETLIRERFTVGRRGQQSYDKFDRSVNTSNKSVWNKLAFLFQSFHEGAWNMMQMSWDEWVHNPKTLASTAKAGLDIGTVWASYAAEQVLRDSIITTVGFAMAAIRRRKRKEPLHWYEWILRPFISILDAIPMIGSAANMYMRNFVRILAKEKPIYGGRVGEPLPLKLINDAFEGADGIGRGVAYYLQGDKEKGNKATIGGIKKLYESIALTQGVPTYEIRRILNATEEEKTETRRSARSRSVGIRRR